MGVNHGTTRTGGESKLNLYLSPTRHFRGTRARRKARAGEAADPSPALRASRYALRVTSLRQGLSPALPPESSIRLSAEDAQVFVRMIEPVDGDFALVTANFRGACERKGKRGKSRSVRASQYLSSCVISSARVVMSTAEHTERKGALPARFIAAALILRGFGPCVSDARIE